MKTSIQHASSLPRTKAMHPSTKRTLALLAIVVVAFAVFVCCQKPNIDCGEELERFFPSRIQAQDAPKPPIGWRDRPIVWIAAPLDTKESRAVISRVLRSSGYPFDFSDQEVSGTLRIYGFSTNRKRAGALGVFCGGECLRHNGGPLRDYLIDIAPSALPNSDIFSGATLVRFGQSDPNTGANKGVSGMIAVRDDTRIVGASCFVNVELGSGERRRLIEQCLIRSLGFVDTYYGKSKSVRGPVFSEISGASYATDLDFQCARRRSWLSGN